MMVEKMTLDFPPIFLLPTRLRPDEMHQLEESIPSITHDAQEGAIFLGRISKKERALFELRKLKIPTREISYAEAPGAAEGKEEDADGHTTKRRKVLPTETIEQPQALRPSSPQANQIVKVVKLTWYLDSLSQNFVLPLNDYLVYEGIKLPAEWQETPPQILTATVNVLTRAVGDLSPASETRGYSKPNTSQALFSTSGQHPPALLHATTSEHDMPLPRSPETIKSRYACQRSTPVDPPNAAFIQALKAVRVVRRLQGDYIGERAYGSAIAVLSAYTYPIHTALEVSELPGCGPKISELWQQWDDTGKLKELVDADSDTRIAVLRLFYEIWGVGDTTAREFYKKGWRDLDDIVEFGWSSLGRVQQIGVKFYDEFQHKMSRSEVELIGEEVLAHARNIEPGFQMVIVGGYRRGKQQSGDADILLSHSDESQTLQFITKIVMSLEKARFITHTLVLSTKSSDRGQTPLPWRGTGCSAGGGFDTLDKALVVWQDYRHPGSPHRRVDIIISPWRTIGCAMLGWSGGNTFERDLRLYCKQVKGWKFDSSGIRSRGDGDWVDLEGGGSAPDMVTAEKRVFEGLGLEYRAPEERCTG